MCFEWLSFAILVLFDVSGLMATWIILIVEVGAANGRQFDFFN